MIKEILDASELAAARELRQSLADGPTELSPHWLCTTGARVLAQESGRHLEVDEAAAVSQAYAAAGVESMVAIVTDALVVEDVAYALDASPQDLCGLSGELAGVNFLLADSAATRCLLFTTDDFKLVAGPLEFVTQIVGDPTTARKVFQNFAADQLEEFRPAFTAAQSYMSWVDDGG
jgi:hypothetical protein